MIGHVALPRIGALFASLLGAGCSAAMIVGADAPDCDGPRLLQVVAHQDDDLLFMSPDLERAIGAGRCVRTVYLTAGDAGSDSSYWGAREAGVQAAYAAMAGAPDRWRGGFRTYAGHLVRVHTLVSAPRISLAFLRLPDGRSRGQGYDRYGFASLEKLWRRQIPALSAVDRSNHFTRARLVEVLEALMRAFEPAVIAILDPMRFHGDEHSDHGYAARFAFEAGRSVTAPHEVRVYRDYNIAAEPINLSPADQHRKWSAFLTYAGHDRLLLRGGIAALRAGAYFLWSQRQYLIAGVVDAGALRDDAGACLAVTKGGDGAETLAPAPCQDLPQQRWALTGDGALRGLGGRCLRAAATGPGLGPCEGAPRWAPSADGRLTIAGASWRFVADW